VKILRRLPLLTASRSIRFGQRHVSFHRNALVIWLSVSMRGEESPRHISTAFPAMLDSGNNSGCFLHEDHLVHWAGMQPNQLETIGSISINSRRIQLHGADVWIHPNTPGTHERDPQGSPFRLEMADGIALGRASPENSPMFPRVPLLGLAAFKANALDYWFDSKTGHSFLRTADWRSRLIRLLHGSF
jgi:hypothetical protein